MRLSHRILVAVAAMGILGSVGAASAFAAPAPVVPLPAGANHLLAPANGQLTEPVTFANGTKGRLVVTGSPVTKVSPPGADPSWSAWVEGDEYGVLGTLWSYRMTVDWTGNYSTISANTPTIRVGVTTYGTLTEWQFIKTISGPTKAEWYGGWAYQDTAQGEFAQCPIIQFACADFQYPYVWMNIYANGTDQYGL